MRLIAEWVPLHFPGATIVMRASVGAIQPSVDATDLTPAELRRLGTARRWVDALVITATEVHLVEAKITLAPGAIAQLKLYGRLFPYTRDYVQFKDWPRSLHLVYAIEDPVVVALANDEGILTHQYRPPWIEDYIQGLEPRKQRPTKPGGIEAELFPGEEPKP
jgi:hypothetical protein